MLIWCAKKNPVINVKTILSVVDVVIYSINTVEQNIAFKTDGF